MNGSGKNRDMFFDSGESKFVCGSCNLPVPPDEVYCPECGADVRAVRCANCNASLHKKGSVVRTYYSKDPDKYDDVVASGHYDAKGYFDSERTVRLERHDLAMDSDRCAACGFVLPM